MPADPAADPPGVTGARRLLESLVACGATTCFANPGTSEMHFVAALDEVPAMRAILALFEGVATGAADGYGRVTGRPATALLHLGPGLANGSANLHNARRARTPLVTVVGDHATAHARLDAPLQSDVEAIAGSVSDWVRIAASPTTVSDDATDAVAAALGRPSGVATLVLPADVSWSPSSVAAGPPAQNGPPVPRVSRAPEEAVEEAARALRSGEPAALLLGGRALRRDPLSRAAAVCEATTARMLAETFPANQERGAGIPEPERIIYLAEMALDQLAGLRHLILVDARAPVSFFAYPGVPGELWPSDCALHTLATETEDPLDALWRLTDRLGAPERPSAIATPDRPEAPSGPLDPAHLAQAIGALLPEDAIVVDEANTGGLFLGGATRGAPPHDWLCLTGGAIGQGLPVATGAAVGGGGRPVLCLEADGSAMYTLQALWTQAREGLDVTTVVLANRAYAILRLELSRVGAPGSGERAGSLLALDRPEIDMVALAQGMGVPASRATTAEELVDQVGRGLASPGPTLVEAVLGA